LLFFLSFFLSFLGVVRFQDLFWFLAGGIRGQNDAVTLGILVVLFKSFANAGISDRDSNFVRPLAVLASSATVTLVTSLFDLLGCAASSDNTRLHALGSQESKQHETTTMMITINKQGRHPLVGAAFPVSFPPFPSP
jgi:hypothetical protein